VAIEKTHLIFRTGRAFDPRMQASYRRLLRDVLGVPEAMVASQLWTAFALFEPGGACVANVDAAILPLFVDGREASAGALRSVAVREDWRGKGLFADLMREALAWCDGRSADVALLYTEEPALYGRFDFRSWPQHAFVGPAPCPRPGARARRLDLTRAADQELVTALIGRRAPVSWQCALGGDAALFLVNLAGDAGLSAVYAEAEDMLIVFEDDADGLTLVDIAAAAIPDLPTVLGLLDARPGRVKTLFPPDRLGWSGAPVLEDTGLMIRGTAPAAFAQPFMFPPTAEF
jgi:GNAT superfamily N-acetyltransferase